MSTEVSSPADGSKRTLVGYNPIPVPRENAQGTLPRVATARVPLLNKVPTEIHLNRNRNVGKSLDETKYITVQKFAHGKILDIGAEIHRLGAQAASKEKEEAIAEAENKVWEHAEEIRIKAIHELQAKLHAQHQEELKRIKKEHDKVLKEEGLRVETAIRQLSLDQVKQEREEGETRLKRAVADVEKRCAQELVTAVKETRAEEREKANAAIETLDRSWQTKYNDIIDQMNEEKKKELNRLSENKDWEKQRAILQTRQVERQCAENELERVTQNYESRIYVLNHKIEEKETELRDFRDAKLKVDYRLKDVAKELFLTRDTLRDYIHLICQCRPGQADYQMPTTKLKREDFKCD